MQRRENGHTNFYRKWKDYKVGFGDVSSEFWMGNELIHHMTATHMFMLRIDLISFEHEHRFAEYADFMIENETQNYMLRLGQVTEDTTAGELVIVILIQSCDNVLLTYTLNEHFTLTRICSKSILTINT